MDKTQCTAMLAPRIEYLNTVSKLRQLRIAIPDRVSLDDIFAAALIYYVYGKPCAIVSTNSMTILEHPTNTIDIAINIGIGIQDKYVGLRYSKDNNTKLSVSELLAETLLSKNLYNRSSFISKLNSITSCDNYADIDCYKINTTWSDYEKALLISKAVCIAISIIKQDLYEFKL